jgi:hypothetical protein
VTYHKDLDATHKEMEAEEKARQQAAENIARRAAQAHTDKITFFTHSDDNIGIEAPNLNDGWDSGQEKFRITLPMDGVTARGTRTVGYVITARVYFGSEDGSYPDWCFELETPEGVTVERITG